MIRIIDEPVFEMTKAEYLRMFERYWAIVDQPTGPIDLMFEDWLSQQGWPHTVQGRIKP
jgi:hypothetical protein